MGSNAVTNLTILFNADTKNFGKNIKGVLNNLDSVEDKYKVLKQYLKDTGKEFEETGDQALDFAKAYGMAMDDIEKQAPTTIQNLELIRMSFSRLLEPIGQLQDEMTQSTSNMQSRLADLQATAGGAFSTEQLKTYGKEILEASVEIGENFDLIGTKMVDALSAGVAEDQLKAQVVNAGKAATATRGTIDTLTDLGNTIRNTYGEAAGSVENIYDLITRTYQLGDVTGEEIGQGFGMVGSAAESAGVPIKQLMGSIATISTKLKPEQTFTGLAAAITEMNTTGSKSQKMLKKLGYESLQAALKEKSLQEIIIELNESGTKINDIFGVEASRAVLALGSNAEKTMSTMQEFEDVSNATADAFKARTENNYEFQMKQAEALKQANLIAIGETVLPLQTKLLQTQNKLLSQLKTAPPILQKVAGGFILGADKGGKLFSASLDIAEGTRGMIESYKAFKSINIGQMFTSLKSGLTNLPGMISSVGISIQTMVPIVLAAVAAYVAFDKIMDKFEKNLEETEKAQTDRTKAGYEQELKFINTMKQRGLVYDEETGKIKNLTDAEVEFLEKRGVLTRVGQGPLGMIKGEAELTIQALESYQKGIITKINKIEEAEKASTEATDENTDALDKNKTIVKELTAEQKKAIAQKKQEIDLINKQTEALKKRNVSDERGQTLAGLKDTEKYFEEKKKYLVEDYRAVTDSLDEQIEYNEFYWDTLTKSEQDKAKALYDYRFQLAQQFINNIKQVKIDYDAWQAGVDAERDAREEERIRKTNERYIAFAAAIGESMGNAMSAGEDGMKQALRNILLTVIDFLENYLMAAILKTSIDTAIMPISAGKLAGVLAMKAGFAGLKSQIASFDIGGIPTMPGMGMLHPGDVIVNPTSENPMMEALTDRLANKINGRQQNVSLQIDGRELGRATINAMNRENETIPVGRRGL